MSSCATRRSDQPATSPRTSRRSSYVATEDRSVGMDPPIAKKWPVAPGFLDQLALAFGDKNRGCRPCFGENPSERIGNEGVTKKFDAVGPGLFFVSNAIRRRDEHSIRDRMRALSGAPCVDLRFAELRLLRGMPANCRRIKKN